MSYSYLPEYDRNVYRKVDWKTHSDVCMWLWIDSQYCIVIGGQGIISDWMVILYFIVRKCHWSIRAEDIQEDGA